MLLRKFDREGKKVLIFSTMTRVLDILQGTKKKENIVVELLVLNQALGFFSWTRAWKS